MPRATSTSWPTVCDRHRAGEQRWCHLHHEQLAEPDEPTDGGLLRGLQLLRQHLASGAIHDPAAAVGHVEPAHTVELSSPTPTPMSVTFTNPGTGADWSNDLYLQLKIPEWGQSFRHHRQLPGQRGELVPAHCNDGSQSYYFSGFGTAPCGTRHPRSRWPQGSRSPSTCSCPSPTTRRTVPVPAHNRSRRSSGTGTARTQRTQATRATIRQPVQLHRPDAERRSQAVGTLP